MPTTLNQTELSYINQAKISFPLKIDGNEEFVLQYGKNSKNGKFELYAYYWDKFLENKFPKIWDGYEMIAIYQDINFCALDTVL